MNIEVLRHKQHIDNLIKKIESFDGDFELQAHLAKYLCIVVCGFLESSIRTIYINYAQSKAENNVANFVNKKLKNFVALPMPINRSPSAKGSRVPK